MEEKMTFSVTYRKSHVGYIKTTNIGRSLLHKISEVPSALLPVFV